jgi:hypothetical protein
MALDIKGFELTFQSRYLCTGLKTEGPLQPKGFDIIREEIEKKERKMV